MREYEILNPSTEEMCHEKCVENTFREGWIYPEKTRENEDPEVWITKPKCNKSEELVENESSE
jgi:hypothetical protein